MLNQAPHERDGEGRGFVHFAYLPVNPGESLTAFVAARVVWVHTHTDKKKTKLCLKRVTGGDLLCPFCDAKMPSTVRGWAGFYREMDGRPIAVWLAEESRAVTDRLALHARVILARAKSVGSPVAVIPSLAPGMEYRTTLRERQRWVNSQMSLVKITGQEYLIEWMKSRRVGAVTTPSLFEPTTDATDRRRPPPTVATESNVVLADNPLSLAASMESVLERLRRKANGHNGVAYPQE
jgi:hypothetical protein